MAQYKVLKKCERETFLEISRSANHFKQMVSDRYYNNGFVLPENVKNLIWFCDTVSLMASDYNMLCLECSLKNLHHHV